MISARTASSAAASEPRVHKSDASYRTLRSLRCKNMADKNDSGVWGGGGRRAFGLEIHCRHASQLRVSMLLFLLNAGVPLWTNYSSAQLHKYRNYCRNNHAIYITWNQTLSKRLNSSHVIQKRLSSHQDHVTNPRFKKKSRKRNLYSI